MARSIQEQLFNAWDGSGRTLLDVAAAAKERAERAGRQLDLDEPSLSRKLRGKQTLRTWEAEILAAVLGIKISAGRAA